MNKARLLNLARALRESPNPDRFDMGTYGHGCNTPACAFGHYAFRGDLQSAFELSEHGRVLDRDGRQLHYDSWRVREHFDVSYAQLDDLFAAPCNGGCDDEACALGGCGGAKTAIEAAEYVERFVRDHELAARGIEPGVEP
jgi:hypothetical protein